MGKKAIQVTLSDGREIFITAPGKDAVNEFLKAMPFFTAFQKVTQAAAQNAEGVLMPIPDIPAPVIAAIDPLLARCASVRTGDGSDAAPHSFRKLTADEISAIDNLFDWLALFNALNEVMPNFPTTTPSSL